MCENINTFVQFLELLLKTYNEVKTSKSKNYGFYGTITARTEKEVLLIARR